MEYATTDDESEINQKFVNKLKEYELGLKHLSFRWASSTGITNSIIMIHYKKEDIIFEIKRSKHI